MADEIDNQSFAAPAINKGDGITADFLNAPIRAINRAMVGAQSPAQVRTGGARNVDANLLPTREQWRAVEFMRPIELWEKGDSITAAGLNETVRAVNTILGYAPPPAQRKRDACLPVVVNVRLPEHDKIEALKEWNKGDDLTAAKLNEPCLALRRIQFGAALPQQIRRDWFPCS